MLTHQGQKAGQRWGPCKSWSGHRPEWPRCADLGQDSWLLYSISLYSTENLLFLWAGITDCTSCNELCRAPTQPLAPGRSSLIRMFRPLSIKSHIPTNTDFTASPEFLFSLYLTGISFSPSCGPCLSLCTSRTCISLSFPYPPGRNAFLWFPLPGWQLVPWISLNPHLYFTFIFLIEKGPHLPWKWNINMQKRLSTRWTGKV